MAKKKFLVPFIVAAGITPVDEDPEIGGGSADTTDEPYPCSFDDWFGPFGDDYNHDSSTNQDDYCQWWLNCGFTWEKWLEFNAAGDWTLTEYPAGH